MTFEALPSNMVDSCRLEVCVKGLYRHRTQGKVDVVELSKHVPFSWCVGKLDIPPHWALIPMVNSDLVAKALAMGKMDFTIGGTVHKAEFCVPPVDHHTFTHERQARTGGLERMSVTSCEGWNGKFTVGGLPKTKLTDP